MHTIFYYLGQNGEVAIVTGIAVTGIVTGTVGVTGTDRESVSMREIDHVIPVTTDVTEITTGLVADTVEIGTQANITTMLVHIKMYFRILLLSY